MRAESARIHSKSGWVEHQPEELAAGLDASLGTLVLDALHPEHCLVQFEQRVSQSGDLLLASGWVHRASVISGYSLTRPGAEFARAFTRLKSGAAMLSQKESEMTIRKFIEEIGEKVIPARRSNNFAAESSESIRRHILSRCDYIPPVDLVEYLRRHRRRRHRRRHRPRRCDRERSSRTWGNIQGVEKVDDRMVSKG
jgi:hypothetical protein